jgi:hypothetical protein
MKKHTTISSRVFTGRDRWIHSLPGLDGKRIQTRDLRGIPNQIFHQWWAREKSLEINIEFIRNWPVC